MTRIFGFYVTIGSLCFKYESKVTLVVSLNYKLYISSMFTYFVFFLSNPLSFITLHHKIMTIVPSEIMSSPRYGLILLFYSVSYLLLIFRGRKITSFGRSYSLTDLSSLALLSYHTLLINYLYPSQE